jgi:hypothetical protein
VFSRSLLISIRSCARTLRGVMRGKNLSGIFTIAALTGVSADKAAPSRAVAGLV